MLASAMGFMHSKGKRTTSALGQFGLHRDFLSGSVSPGQSGSVYTVGSKVQIRVRADGQAEFISWTRLWGDEANRVQPARETYVLYDPQHPEHCDIDRERLTKEFGSVRVMGKDKQRIMIPEVVSRARRPQAAAPSDSRARVLVAARPADDLAASLAQLGELHANGTLTDLEFAEAKGRLLDPS